MQKLIYFIFLGFSGRGKKNILERHLSLARHELLFFSFEKKKVQLIVWKILPAAKKICHDKNYDNEKKNTCHPLGLLFS